MGYHGTGVEGITVERWIPRDFVISPCRLIPAVGESERQGAARNWIVETMKPRPLKPPQ